MIIKFSRVINVKAGLVTAGGPWVEISATDDSKSINSPFLVKPECILASHNVIPDRQKKQGDRPYQIWKARRVKQNQNEDGTAIFSVTMYHRFLNVENDKPLVQNWIDE